MKLRIILISIFLGLFSATDLHAQQVSQGAYKSWQYFKPDTTVYLDYNWNRNNASRYLNQPLSAFFKQLELPIKAVRIRMTKNNVILLSLYYRPYSEVIKLSFELRGYRAILIPLTETPLISSLESAIPALKSRDKMLPVCDVVIPWKDSYMELFKNYSADYIMYSNLR